MKLVEDFYLWIVSTVLLKDFCIVLFFENTEAFEYNFNKYFTPLLLAGNVSRHSIEFT